MKQFKKNIFSLIVLILVVVLVFGCSKTIQIITFIEKGDYLSAMEEYAKLSDEASRNVAEAQIEEKCSESIENYNQGAATLEEANALLQTVEKTKILTDQEMREAKERLNRLKGSKEAYQIAEDYYAKENYIAAIDFYKNVIREDSRFEDAQSKLELARDKYIEQVKETAALAASENDYQAAISALTICSNNLGGVSELEMLIGKYKTDNENYQVSLVLEKVETYLQEADYVAALVLLCNASFQYPNRDDLYSKTEQSEKQYVKYIIEEAEKLYAEDKYDEAMAILHTASAYVTDQPDLNHEEDKLTNAYTLAVRTKARAEAETLVASNDYPGAIAVLDDAIDRIGYDSELVEYRGIYEDTYADQVLSSVADTYLEYDIVSLNNVCNIISEGLSIIPANGVLQEAYALYNNKWPIRLMDLPISHDLFKESIYFGLNSFDYYGTIQDTLGNEHFESIAPKYWSHSDDVPGIGTEDCWARSAWETDYQYSRIEGVFFFDSKYKSSSVTVKLIIYSKTDETVLKQEYTVSSSVGAVCFSVDLKGSKLLGIYIEQSERTDKTFAYLSDVYIWR